MVKHFAVAPLGVTDHGFSAEVSARCLTEALRQLPDSFQSLVELIIVSESNGILAPFHQIQNTIQNISTCQGSLFRLFTRHGIIANSILVETSWRILRPQTTSSKTLNSCDGSILNFAKTRFDVLPERVTGSTSVLRQHSPVRIRLSEVPDSVLRDLEQFDEVVLCCPPNRNAERVDFIGDEQFANKLLVQCWKEVLEFCLSDDGVVVEKPIKNAFTELLRPKVKPEQPKPKPPSARNWSDALLLYVQNPQNLPRSLSPLPSAMYSYNEKFSIVWDEFPKASAHLLVIPRRVIGLRDLTAKDIGLVQEMFEMGSIVVKELHLDPSNVLMGFHALPSMRQLHMHVLTKDFNSPFMKKRHHFNSFTTEFFRTEKFLLRDLALGKLPYEDEKESWQACLKKELVCWCGQTLRVSEIQPHVKTHPQ